MQKGVEESCERLLFVVSEYIHAYAFCGEILKKSILRELILLAMAVKKGLKILSLLTPRHLHYSLPQIKHHMRIIIAEDPPAILPLQFHNSTTSSPEHGCEERSDGSKEARPRLKLYRGFLSTPATCIYSKHHAGSNHSPPYRSN